MAEVPKCCRAALRRGARTLPVLAVIIPALLLTSGGPAVPQDKAGRAHDNTVRERKRQFALKQLDAIEGELLEVQAQLRKARIAILLAKEMLKEKHAETLDEALRNDPAARQLQTTIDRGDQEVRLWRERSPNPEAEPGYQRLLKEQQSARAQLAQRRDALLQQLLEKMPVEDLLSKERVVRQRVDHLRKVEEFLTAEWENRLKAMADLK